MSHQRARLLGATSRPSPLSPSLSVPFSSIWVRPVTPLLLIRSCKFLQLERYPQLEFSVPVIFSTLIYSFVSTCHPSYFLVPRLKHYDLYCDRSGLLVVLQAWFPFWLLWVHQVVSLCVAWFHHSGHGALNARLVLLTFLCLESARIPRCFIFGVLGDDLGPYFLNLSGISYY